MRPVFTLFCVIVLALSACARDDAPAPDAAEDPSPAIEENAPEPGSEPASETDEDTTSDMDEPSLAEDGPAEDADNSQTRPLAERQPVRAPLTGASAITGSYAAMSSTAMGVTGEISFKADIISFGKGQTLTTRLMETVPASSAYNADGDSWADLLYVPEDTQVELREVIASVVNNDAQQLCGGTPVRWLALASKTATKGTPTTISLALMDSKQPPGPEATGNLVCATYSYTG